MKARMIWANFSVKDAERTRQFYTQLGFAPNGPNNYPKLASFLFGDNGFVIHFFEQGGQIGEYLPVGKTGEVMFTLSADTAEEVNEWSDRVKAAGGTLVKAPTHDNTNHYGFTFADPDGHQFNVLLVAGM